MMTDKLTNPVLAPYREQILKTEKPTIEMELFSPAENLPLWQSKVGGKPYLPKGENYPMSKDGKPLTLLVQINFEEMPPLEDYPTKGILQFFVDSQDDLIGADFDNPTEQNEFRVLYHANVVKDNEVLQQEFPKIDENEFYMPYNYGEEFAISFKRKEQFVPTGDYSFEEIIPDLYDLDDEVGEAICDDDELCSSGHRIGGYPYFTQSDPREFDTIPKDYKLLLQLDSDDYLMWGDCGVGNFFIYPEDLKVLDFSKVAYTWDCC